MQASLPVFMKLLVAVLVFAFFPFLVLTLLISWGYDSSFQSLVEEASILPHEKALLISQFQDLEHELRIKLGFVFLVFSICMIVGVWLGTSFLVSPLTRFLDAVRKLEQGDFGVKVDIQTSDEFAILGYYFNKMSKQIEETLTREQEVSRMKSEFLSIAAHQLRTPLSALKWVLNMAFDGDAGELTKTQKELLKKGYAANERMVTLVNDLLDVVRIEEGRFDYKFKTGSLVNLLEEIIKEVRVLAENKGIVFKLRKPPFPVMETAFDPVKLRLALLNIIGNAILYTSPIAIRRYPYGS